jgi:hypothetical protein
VTQSWAETDLQKGLIFAIPFFFFFRLEEISAISSVFAEALEEVAVEVPVLVSI